jgi:hypothetical protein
MHALVLIALVGLALAVGVSRFGWPWRRERASVTAEQKRQFVESLLPQAEEAMRQRGASEDEICEALAKVRAAEGDLNDSKSDHVPGAW